MAKIKILIAEDSKLTVVGLKAMLAETGEFEIVDIVFDGQSAVKKALELKPDIILMDIGLPVLDGIQATKIIKKKNENLKIIMLTSHNNEEDVLDALSAGAASYCLKDIETDEFINVIKTTFNGASWLAPEIAKIVLSNLNSEENKSIKKNLLTEREIEILNFIAKGFSNLKISETLYISLNTVKTHTKNIFNKLEVEDRTQAALKAIKEDLI
ncbi:MAG: response regulator transcription factor [Candidatus Gastranaerophilaceae bacterium]|jgi:DNA-binding NarL/FixJ family response regulator